jgi:serine/threonine-protein kinase
VQFNAGETIGNRFEVLKKLGQGGIGIVYLVQDLQRKHPVALKILKPEISRNDLAMERFKREVKALRQITIPGIVQVFDTGQIETTLFYTMEFVEGTSVSDLIRRKAPLPLDDAHSLMEKICKVLASVHEVVVHRDISSDNVMLSENGSVHLLDFGTARLVDEDSKLTVQGMHLGKICYSAPEQRLDSRAVDHRADLYSLGVLFYELLTGELIVAYEPVTGYRQELSPTYDAFFEKALAENPDDRFDSIGEFSQGLSQLR